MAYGAPVTVSVTAVSEVVGSATGIPATGVGNFPTVTYTAELATLAGQVDALAAQIDALNLKIDGMLLSFGGMATSLAGIAAFLRAVQTPAGNIRTEDVSERTGDTLVSSALLRAGIDIPPGGVT